MALVRVDPDAFPTEAMPCLRCGEVAEMRFAGPCPSCVEALRDKYRGEHRAVDGAEYEPKMNVTPNAVALKDD
jgi:hypothetical protein